MSRAALPRPSRRLPRRLSGRLGAAALAPVLLALAACGNGADGASAEGPADGERLSVVTTVAPLTSITANIAGERADVTGVVPEGTNSHTFEPPPQVAAVLEGADLVVVNGLQLEEPVADLAEELLDEDARLLRLGDAVLPEDEWIFDFSFPEEDGKPNPHLWTDPTYAKRYAEQVRDALVEADPEGREEYEANAEAYLEKLDALDAALRADQESVPQEDRLLLTYHDAYAYFARTYGWEVVGAVQPSDFEDPQPREVARIVDQVRDLDVPVVFGSEVFPSPVLEQIARETGARYEDTLRDDDLPGEPGDPEHSFLGLMRYDFVTMIEGLGGSAPELAALDVSDVAPDSAEYPQ